ncbi:hypothetical protein [Streptomyces sp. 2-6]|uniref:hypothetical protein n=1 Tax=unclassified Streptomyces TaxID=2593676 RepID=UPI003D121813
MRADAARGARLDFGLLRSWQRYVLATPRPQPLRGLPAFTKGGQERYGIGPGTRDLLDAGLAQSARNVVRPAEGPSVPPPESGRQVQGNPRRLSPALPAGLVQRRRAAVQGHGMVDGRFLTGVRQGPAVQGGGGYFR